MYRSFLNNLQPCMEDYHTQKENWSCPEKKVENKYLLNGWQMDWQSEWRNECQYWCSITTQTANLKSWLWHPEKKIYSSQKEVARKICSSQQRCAISGSMHLFILKNHPAFLNLLHSSNFTSWDTEDRLVVLLTMSSSTFWNKSCFWRWAH